MLAHDPADPAAEREARHAGVRDDPRGNSEPERLRLAVELTEQHTCLHARGTRVRIDPHALQRREVDHQRVVCDRETRKGVAAAAHRDRQAALASELDRCDHVGDR